MYLPVLLKYNARVAVGLGNAPEKQVAAYELTSVNFSSQLS
jgi:hypothetical protein